jgi:hypothetical protein
MINYDLIFTPFSQRVQMSIILNLERDYLKVKFIDN